MERYCLTAFANTTSRIGRSTGILGNYQDLGVQAENGRFRVSVLVLAWLRQPFDPRYRIKVLRLRREFAAIREDIKRWCFPPPVTGSYKHAKNNIAGRIIPFYA